MTNWVKWTSRKPQAKDADKDGKVVFMSSTPDSNIGLFRWDTMFFSFPERVYWMENLPEIPELVDPMLKAREEYIRHFTVQKILLKRGSGEYTATVAGDCEELEKFLRSVIRDEREKNHGLK